MTIGNELHTVAEADPDQSGGGSIGDGDLVDHLLGALECRVGKLEDLVSDIRDAVTAVKEQMKSVATKHTVSIWIVGMVVVNFLTLAGHFLIGSFGGP